MIFATEVNLRKRTITTFLCTSYCTSFQCVQFSTFKQGQSNQVTYLAYLFRSMPDSLWRSPPFLPNSDKKLLFLLRAFFCLQTNYYVRLMI